MLFVLATESCCRSSSSASLEQCKQAICDGDLLPRTFRHEEDRFTGEGLPCLPPSVQVAEEMEAKLAPDPLLFGALSRAEGTNGVME